MYDTYISSLQTITRSDTQVTVSRSLTALRSVSMSLDKAFTEGRIKCCNRSWTTCYSTMLGNRNGPRHINESDNEIQHLQLMIGSKMYPEHPIRSHAESFFRLRKSLGVQYNSLYAVDSKGNQYRNHIFVVGFDTEKMLGLAFTGVNSKSSLITIKFKTNSGDYQASRMHLVLVSQQGLEVGGSGITIVE